MEWVTTTGRSVEDATEVALDQLGVAADEADIEVLEEPKSGLFGRTRGEAKVRGRVRPTEVRPKRDNRRSRGNKNGANSGANVKDLMRRVITSRHNRARMADNEILAMQRMRNQ